MVAASDKAFLWVPDESTEHFLVRLSTGAEANLF